MNSGLNKILTFRINKAYQTYDQALLLMENGMADGVINRLYYACFYMVSALLLRHDLISKSHVGTKILFHKEFIKTGLIQDSNGQLYQQLFDLRNEADYDDMAAFSVSEVSPLILEVNVFLKKINSFIEVNT